ncbi:hypothetical protein CVT26_015020 [Gymnopilus dilepis]|uniref:F-box domain-containing protein n=1 Tax=Gymnopilus dilepis TaxID=231916 RepID=A0A409YNZ2_9AGAR|nr:hypothetical protein CVT26_015020 [Gymnopilus dilepis]
MLIQHSIGDKLLPEVPDYDIFPFQDVDDVEFGTIKEFSIYGITADPTPRRLTGYLKKRHRISSRKAQLQEQVHPNFPFSTLPIDLGLLVLGHLHPLDLYQFTFVSKLMRSIVLSKALAQGAWRSSYERHPDVPAPPPRMVSEPRWTFILFGPDICSHCGDRGAAPVFALAEKYCWNCRDDFAALGGKICDYGGNRIEGSHPVLSLIPREPTVTGHRYRPSDILATLKKVTLMQILVNYKIQGLAVIFEADKQILKKRVSVINAYTLRAKAWEFNLLREAEEDRNLALKYVCTRFSKWLCKQGYKPWDISQSGLRKFVDHYDVQKASFPVFQRSHQLIMEYAIHDRHYDSNSRRRFLTRMFTFYESRTKDAWEMLPHSSLVVDSFLQSRFTEDMTYNEVEQLFPSFIKEASEAERANLALQLPENLRADASGPGAMASKVSLATAVFSCFSCRSKAGDILIGWKTICRHMRVVRISGCTLFRFNPRLSAITAALVTVSGLRYETATVDDMDNKNDRFLCGECRPLRRHRMSSLRSYTWFDMLHHLWRHHRTLIATGIVPAIHLLSSEARDFVVDHEEVRFRPTWRVWRCSMCDEYDMNWASYQEIIVHSKKEHFVEDPLKARSIEKMKHSPIRSRHYDFRLWVEPHHNCVCLRCPIPGRRRLFTRSLVLKHLETNHSTLDPQEFMDWTRMTIVAATTPCDSQSKNLPKVKNED